MVPCEILFQVTTHDTISNTCDIQTLQVEYDLIVEKCDKAIDGSQICTVSDGENLYEYKCVNQVWELAPGTGKMFYNALKFV
jgi:hypothetical protein